MEQLLQEHPGDSKVFENGKTNRISDKEIGLLWQMDEKDIFHIRKQHGILPVYK